MLRKFRNLDKIERLEEENESLKERLEEIQEKNGYHMAEHFRKRKNIEELKKGFMTEKEYFQAKVDKLEKELQKARKYK